MAALAKNVCRLALFFIAIVVAFSLALFLLITFFPEHIYTHSLPVTNSLSLCLSEFKSYELCNRMDNLFSKEPWPPIWFFLTSAIAALLSSAAFVYTVWYNRRKDSDNERERLSNVENDIYDKFWFREVMFNKSVKPMLDYVLGVTEEQEKTANSIDRTSVDKLLRYIANHHSSTRKQLLSLKDFHGYFDTHKRLVERLEKLRDKYVSITSQYIQEADISGCQSLPASNDKHKELVELIQKSDIHEVYSELVNIIATTHHDLASRK